MKRLAFLCLLLLAACRPVSSADAGPAAEAGVAIVNDVCSLIEGVDDSGVLRTICATVEEIAAIASFILTLRTNDAGSPAACVNIPKTQVCATSAERAKGVLYLARVRAARLTLDGGAR